MAAPFLKADELKNIFGGKELFTDPNLNDTFKGLLGIDGVPKPFECIGEIEELRTAYKMAQSRGGYGTLPFSVPESHFDYTSTYPSQHWFAEMLK